VIAGILATRLAKKTGLDSLHELIHPPREPQSLRDATPPGPPLHRGGERWDFGESLHAGGRLIVNRPFAALLHTHGLTTCQAFLEFAGGEVVRSIGTRETRRVSLDGSDGIEVVYLKRHDAPRWRDRIKPLLHLARPIHGARPEWEAILQFAALGLPTMTPIAFGEQGSRSFLVTQALPASCNLLEYVERRVGCAHHALEQSVGKNNSSPLGGHSPPYELRDLIARVAAITRRMHDAGLHHQDLYLNHLLLCDGTREADVRVIDLGRVRQRKKLANRWIIKDLAQLNFSARGLPCRERLRFLRLYLDRPFTPADRQLIRHIAFKSRRIARHTAKHRL
jgi:heptose I phosphotransferase